jgi:hypothetical protein
MDAAVTQLSQRGIPNLLGGPGMRNAEEENPLENIRRHEVDLREEFNHGSEERKAQILEILRNRHRTDTRGRAQDVEYAKRAFRDDLRELWGGSSEYRADTTSTGSLGTFLTPQHMTEEWGNYLEAAGSVWAAGTPLPLAEHGIEQYLPRLTGPINVTTQPQADENDSISQTDPSATYSSSAIVPIVAVSTVSYQAYQRSGGDAGAGFALDKMYARQFAIGTGVQRDNLVIPVLISAAYNTISDSASAGYAPFMQDVARAQALIATQPGVFLPSDRVFLSSPFLRYLEQTTDDEGRPIFPPASYGGKFAQDGSGDTGDQVGGAVICTDDNSLLAFLTAGTASAGFSASSGYGLVGQFEQGLLTFASSAPIFDVWPEGLAQTLTMVLTFRTYASFQTPLGGGPFAVLTGSYYGLGA